MGQSIGGRSYAEKSNLPQLYNPFSFINTIQTGGIQIQYRSSTYPGFNLVSKVINFVTLTNCFEGKKFFFYCQIMVLNFTRNANSLILMSHYIAEEQNLPANLQ